MISEERKAELFEAFMSAYLASKTPEGIRLFLPYAPTKENDVRVLDSGTTSL